MSGFSFNNLSGKMRSRACRLVLSPNETVFREGAPVESVFLVEKGCVRLVVFPQDGKQMVLYRVQAGEAFAFEHLGLEEYCYWAVTDESSVVQSVSKRDLLMEIDSNPEMANQIISCMSRRYYQLRTNFMRLGIASAKARVLHLLNSLSVEKRQPIDLNGKIKSFSDDLNLTHEATYRSLRELENDGVIKRSGGVIELLDFPNAM